MAERHDEQLLGFATLDKIFPVIDTVDSLDSDVRVRPLAARQGKVLKEMIEAIKTMKIKIVEELPDTGSNDTIYLVRDPKSEEVNNTYIEYVWISTEQRYEVIGSLGNIKVDDVLSDTSENPVQNKVIFKAIKNIAISQATDDKLGGFKTGYSANGKNYPVVLDENGKAYVTVPWSDTTFSLNKASDNALGGIMIGYSQNDKNYPVVLDPSGKAYVNVPWTDTNTTYNNATQESAGLMSSKDKTKLDNLVGVPNGGTKGQVLKKTSSGVEWGTDEKGFELPSGGSDGQVLKKNGATATWQDDKDTTYENATQSQAGLMSAEDKTKLDGITSAYATILTQEEYDSLNPKEDNRVYYIKG